MGIMRPEIPESTLRGQVQSGFWPLGCLSGVQVHLLFATRSKYIRVLPFTSHAIERYRDLRARLPRLGKMDLSIAAIAFEYDGIVVTRNRRDFEQVPGLEIQDWSQPENAELT